MKTEAEVKSRITPEIIKEMCELAEGFNTYVDEYTQKIIDYDILFSLLIHRACSSLRIVIDYEEKRIYSYELAKEFEFKNYQKESLTQLECALLDCLVDVLEDV